MDVNQPDVADRREFSKSYVDDIHYQHFDGKDLDTL